MEVSPKTEYPRSRLDWRERLFEAFEKSRPLVAQVGSDKFEIRKSSQDCVLTKNEQVVYSTTSTNAAYVLARFFILAKDSVLSSFESSSSIVHRCVLESLIRDALDKNVVVGQDADKLRDVLATVFWSETEDASGEK